MLTKSQQAVQAIWRSVIKEVDATLDYIIRSLDSDKKEPSQISCTHAGGSDVLSPSACVPRHELPVTQCADCNPDFISLKKDFCEECRKIVADPEYDDDGPSSVELLAIIMQIALNAAVPDVISILVDVGADIEAKSRKGRTAISVAAQHNFISCIEVILATGGTCDSADDDGRTPLMEAALRDHSASVHLLLSAGADINATDQYGCTSLMLATIGSARESIKILVAAGAVVNRADVYEDTPLLVASYGGNMDNIQMLVDAGANLEARNHMDRTALLNASIRAHANALKLLLAAGADMLVVDEDGCTALMHAAVSGLGVLYEEDSHDDVKCIHILMSPCCWGGFDASIDS